MTLDARTEALNLDDRHQAQDDFEQRERDRLAGHGSEVCVMDDATYWRDVHPLGRDDEERVS